MANGGRVGAELFLPTTTNASGVWNAVETPQYISRNLTQNYAVWPVTKDSSFSSVSFLCHFETIGTTSASHPTIVDTIGNNPLFLSNSTSGPTTTQAKFGQQSLWCQGNTGDGVWATGSVAAVQFGTNDFTVEGWFYLVSLAQTQVLLDFRSNTGTFVTPNWYVNPSNNLIMFANGADRITGATSISSNTWYYWCYERFNGTGKLWMGTSGTATQQGSNYTDSNNYTAGAIVVGNQPATGGGGAPGVNPVRGYTDEIRVTKNTTTSVARYGGSAPTVPTAPFPDY